MHGVAPHMCGQVGHPLLDRGAGGRSPGYLAKDSHQAMTITPAKNPGTDSAPGRRARDRAKVPHGSERLSASAPIAARDNATCTAVFPM
jgi:hypothetical protein